MRGKPTASKCSNRCAKKSHGGINRLCQTFQRQCEASWRRSQYTYCSSRSLTERESAMSSKRLETTRRVEGPAKCHKSLHRNGSPPMLRAINLRTCSPRPATSLEVREPKGGVLEIKTSTGMRWQIKMGDLYGNNMPCVPGCEKRSAHDRGVGHRRNMVSRTAIRCSGGSFTWSVMPEPQRVDDVLKMRRTAILALMQSHGNHRCSGERTSW